MILPPNKRYSVMSAEDIISELERFSEFVNIDLSINKILNGFIKDIKSILTDPYSLEQLEALSDLAKGIISLDDDETRSILGFSIKIIENAMIAVRELDISTEEVQIIFPEKHYERYLQLYLALESFRQPSSHEQFSITYRNKDKSTLNINTADGTLIWTNIKKCKLYKSNLNSCEIYNYLCCYIKGNYQRLESDFELESSK